jgi:hypothetical protein
MVSAAFCMVDGGRCFLKEIGRKWPYFVVSGQESLQEPYEFRAISELPRRVGLVEQKPEFETWVRLRESNF